MITRSLTRHELLSNMLRCSPYTSHPSPALVGPGPLHLGLVHHRIAQLPVDQYVPLLIPPLPKNVENDCALHLADRSRECQSEKTLPFINII